LSTGGLLESRPYTPGASSFVSSRAPEGLSGGGIKPGGAWVNTSGGTNTAGIRGLNPAQAVLLMPFLIASCVLVYRSVGWRASYLPPTEASELPRVRCDELLIAIQTYADAN